MYYAADYDSYKEMFDEINARLDKEKKSIEKKLKAEEKKAAKDKKAADAKKAAEAKKKKLKETPKDSVKKKVIKKVNIDSIKRMRRLQHKGL
jgi:ATPase subunit of ABC transporter with duplicated ATPase domains